jgi:hypothetical protein
VARQTADVASTNVCALSTSPVPRGVAQAHRVADDSGGARARVAALSGDLPRLRRESETPATGTIACGNTRIDEAQADPIVGR